MKKKAVIEDESVWLLQEQGKEKVSTFNIVFIGP